MGDKKPPLIIIAGPTAVGKTSVSIEVAKNINGEIISADSMQIYKYMDIGTAKISKTEMNGIEHYLIDEIYPDDSFSVSDFQSKATEYIALIRDRGKLPIVVGGTGLYINSLVYDLDFTQAISNWELRSKYIEKAKQYGNQCIYEELKELDIESANRIHINDTKRIIRALEIYHETGKPMSYFYKDFRKENDKYNIIFIGLTMDRDKLYERINRRVDIMIESGLIEEVKKLLNMGYSEDLVSMQGLGYKEIIQYLKGNYSLDESIEILKRDSRRYAKRQLTWFRRDKNIEWINIHDFDNSNKLIDCVVKNIKEKL
ncbi:tRNA (adenosine(37)-N6)-dimethylallyltransferase MiaA [Proteiniborus sp. MB09-C3]|uniref:tRNA (adenosine(37)-N6)-dimethylallyltransferase MiaA n=1 Tax=Proteiniborus sp. MB09-C3 TaxID=3050072 RepID=UPI002554FB16|nr:tRNA (adenosine(37)-N6)-dimethylallyltransferase MiaA [Proteiniborus sp. MB09-C3]WIV10937.1 tRNA (adenosine(37)-N6)-dimethylallyltransferase MiaA [Proteiniborus sp. MB09-C3]